MSRIEASDNNPLKKGFIMAIPWLAVLAAVPWKQVIEKAPQVADGAKKLWSSVAGKSIPDERPASNAGQTLPDDTQALADRVTEVEARSADLHRQMLASSELIKTLAEQNAQLIQRIETNRVRVLWLIATTLITLAVALVGLVLAIARNVS